MKYLDGLNAGDVSGNSTEINVSLVSPWLKIVKFFQTGYVPVWNFPPNGYEGFMCQLVQTTSGSFLLSVVAEAIGTRGMTMADRNITATSNVKANTFLFMLPSPFPIFGKQYLLQYLYKIDPNSAYFLFNKVKPNKL